MTQLLNCFVTLKLELLKFSFLGLNFVFEVFDLSFETIDSQVLCADVGVVVYRFQRLWCDWPAATLATCLHGGRYTLQLVIDLLVLNSLLLQSFYLLALFVCLDFGTQLVSQFLNFDQDLFG